METEGSYFVHNSFEFFPILSHVKPVYTLTSSVLTVHFKIILFSTSSLQSDLFKVSPPNPWIQLFSPFSKPHGSPSFSSRICQ